MGAQSLSFASGVAGVKVESPSQSSAVANRPSSVQTPHSEVALSWPSLDIPACNAHQGRSEVCGAVCGPWQGEMFSGNEGPGEAAGLCPL
eukprot:3294671-Ditylum_brightwellii.AAC.1